MDSDTINPDPHHWISDNMLNHYRLETYESARRVLNKARTFLLWDIYYANYFENEEKVLKNASFWFINLSAPSAATFINYSPGKN